MKLTNVFTWTQVCDKIEGLPPGTKVRLQDAGDLPGEGAGEPLVQWSEGNSKTGCPSTRTERGTCPKNCRFRPDAGGGCYAHYGRLRPLWDALTRAGGYVGSDRISRRFLGMVVKASKGKKVWTYTHHRVTGSDNVARHNRNAVRHANRNGMAVNVSAHNLAEADELATLRIGPVVAVVPLDYPMTGGRTPAGHQVIGCPHAYGKVKDCKTCMLCAIVERRFVIAFPAHSQGKKRVLAVVHGERHAAM